jgi:hypothetical protein
MEISGQIAENLFVIRLIGTAEFVLLAIKSFGFLWSFFQRYAVNLTTEARSIWYEYNIRLTLRILPLTKNSISKIYRQVQIRYIINEQLLICQ